MFSAPVYVLEILFIKLGQVKVFPSFVALLVEIDRPDAVLIIFDIRCNIHDKIVAPHIAQQPGETPLIELHKFLGDADLVGLRRPEVFFRKISPGIPGICSSTGVFL